ncbi:sensor histidine kinase [Rheinheimera sp. WS51]|uniref:sensor histidine kinase n=1 Tax=Rheinheimera sp. WS51 TaxID=3425886 RepID=UPI003D92829E
MTRLRQLQQQIALSQCSRAYLWAQLATLLVYLLYFMGYTIPFVNAGQTGLLITFVAKYIVDAASFILLSHILLRPQLKQLQRHGFNFKSLLCFALLLLFAATLQAILSYLLSQLELLKSTDMSLLTVNDPAKDSAFQMTFTTSFILLSYSMMFAGMYLVWTFAYVLWHNWQAKRLMQQQMQQAQLQQLTNQLSPHFLFNAFNSIRALIFEDQDKAADTVTRLSELFRFHLQAHLQPESSLEQEWQLTEQYLAIEQVRLEQRLQLQISLAPELLQQQLPTLSLLTLVENAIKHGIAPNSAPGQLIINCAKTKQGWYLSVTNTTLSATTQAGTNTGLANLRQRLQLMYASKARLLLQHNYNHFSARIEFEYV